MSERVRLSLQRAAAGAERGQGMFEYALVIMLVALVVVGAVTIIGTSVASLFNSATGSIGG